MPGFGNVIMALRSVRKSLGAWSGGEKFARVFLHPIDAQAILEAPWASPAPGTVVIMWVDPVHGPRVIEAFAKPGTLEVKIDNPPQGLLQTTQESPFVRRPGPRISVHFEADATGRQDAYTINILPNG